MLVKGSQVWRKPRAISVPASTFLNGECLFKMERKALLKSNQASAGNDVVIAEIQEALKTAEGYFEGKLVRVIFKRVSMFMDLGLYLVDSLIIFVRLRSSSLDCRTAGVLLSISQFRSPNSSNSEDRWGAINSHMVSRAQLGAKGCH